MLIIVSVYLLSQVKAFYKFLTTIDDRSKYMLIMAGGCRNKGDEGSTCKMLLVYFFMFCNLVCSPQVLSAS